MGQLIASGVIFAIILGLTNLIVVVAPIWAVQRVTLSSVRQVFLVGAAGVIPVLVFLSWALMAATWEGGNGPANQGMFVLTVTAAMAILLVWPLCFVTARTVLRKQPINK